MVVAPTGRRLFLLQEWNVGTFCGILFFDFFYFIIIIFCFVVAICDPVKDVDIIHGLC